MASQTQTTSLKEVDSVFISDFEVDFGTSENASIAYSSLAVDKELQPDKVRREMTLSDSKIFVRFEAVEARFLRASFSSFLDLMILSAQFIEQYGGRNLM